MFSSLRFLQCIFTALLKPSTPGKAHMNLHSSVTCGHLHLFYSARFTLQLNDLLSSLYSSSFFSPLLRFAHMLFFTWNKSPPLPSLLCPTQCTAQRAHAHLALSVQCKYHLLSKDFFLIGQTKVAFSSFPPAQNFVCSQYRQCWPT